MGSGLYRNNGNQGGGFRAVELTGRATRDHQTMNQVNHVLLLSNDPETLHYAQQHLSTICRLAVMVRKPAEELTHSVRNESHALWSDLEYLFDSLVRTGVPHLLERMTSSMKTALLSLACDRYKSDRTLICRALGLTDEQLDHEMRTYGVIPPGDQDG